MPIKELSALIFEMKPVGSPSNSTLINVPLPSFSSKSQSMGLNIPPFKSSLLPDK